MYCKNNKGFSLAELLVVVAVAMILTGFVTVSIVIVHNANVGDAANRLESMINSAKVQSMARGEEAGRLTLTMDGDVVMGTIGDGMPEKISSSMINAHVFDRPSGMDFPSKAHMGAMTDWHSVPSIEIRFNSAGMVKSVTGDVDCFVFSRNDRAIAVILYPETGKVDTSIMD